MKKVFSVVFAAGFVCMCACGGPSEAEKKAIEDSAKAQMDALFDKANENMNSMPADSGSAAPADSMK